MSRFDADLRDRRLAQLLANYDCDKAAFISAARTGQLDACCFGNVLFYSGADERLARDAIFRDELLQLCPKQIRLASSDLLEIACERGNGEFALWYLERVMLPSTASAPYEANYLRAIAAVHADAIEQNAVVSEWLANKKKG